MSVLESFTRDARFALRQAVRRPGLTLTVVVTLGLGIGTVTAVLSLVYGVLLRPLPFSEPKRVLTVWQAHELERDRQGRVAPGNFAAWRDQNRVFEAMASVEPYGFDVIEGGDPERIGGWLVSPGFFGVLGAQALHGRTFTPEEEANADGDPVAVLEHGFWQRRFGADPAVVGSDLRLSGRVHRVVGVMPPGFDFPTGREVWVARVFSPRQEANRSETNLVVIGRLREGATAVQASDDLGAVAARLAEDHPTTNRGIGIAVVPIGEHLVGEVRAAFLLLLLAVGLVYLIVCSNVSSLLMMRGLERRGEIACRAALGAGRWRLLRQMLAEGLVLALLGALPGIVLAFILVRLAGRLEVLGIPRLAEVALEPRVLFAAVLLAVLTGVLFGLVPGLRLWRTRAVGGLEFSKQHGSAGSGVSRRRRYLVAFEVALAVVLLCATGLLIRSFERLMAVDPGFETARIGVVEVHVWSRFQAPDERAVFFDETERRLAARADIEAAGAVSALPLFPGRSEREIPFFVESREPPPADRQLTALHSVATVGYFETLGIPRLSGRLFTEADRRGSRRVALVNRALAERYWPDGDPVGERVLVHFLGPPMLREIVGVVEDTRQSSLAEAARPEIFIPHLQEPVGSMTFVVRARPGGGDPLRIASDEIRAGAPDLAFGAQTTMGGLVADAMAPRRLSTLLLGSLSVIAVLLAALGVYGLISTSTSQRRREIGLRLALGGQPADILGMILWEAVPWVVLGVAGGCLGVLASKRVLSSLLFDVRSHDPVTLAVVAALMLAVGTVAVVVPARSAMRLDPASTLRHD